MNSLVRSIYLYPSMNIHKDYLLTEHNTFGIAARAEQFVAVTSVEELRAMLKATKHTPRILGGGSNILLSQDQKGLLIHNQIKGRKIEKRFKHCAYVSAGGGENWHEFVLWCLQQKLGGIENLSLIPGTVGASPIQNIGAYGVELESVFHKLEAIDLTTGGMRIFRKKDCAFGYRDSIFKKELKGKFCITKVWFKLSVGKHQLNLQYGAIRDTLKEMKVKKPSIDSISKAVIHIRSSKLPDPDKLGNSGSFFKNPEISKRQLKQIQQTFPEVVFYDLPNGKVKVPAGWLIERAGWKGKRVGNTGSHARQALVLVNYGGATGQEILSLAKQIQASVKEKFGVKLDMEVNLW